MHQQNLAPFIWNIADLLLGSFKPSEYGRIILPFTVLRRLECVLEPTRDEVATQYASFKGTQIDLDLVLPNAAKANFYNVSAFSLASVGSTSTRANLEDYIAKFSANARQVFEHFAFDKWLAKLESANLLYLVTQKFAAIDLHPEVISNHEMGLVFEHLIRKFAESSNDDAGQYFTPRDVVRLATTLVFAPDHDALSGQGVVRTVYDCAAGTGGFLSSAIEKVFEWNPNTRLIPYAQELNPETYAISVADKLIQGYDTSKIKLGNTLSNDQLPHEQFDYCLANPPFGVKWENVQKQVIAEKKNLGAAGRFGAGLPRVGDGSLLFLMHLLSKRKPVAQGGSRIGIVLSGSPLFNGGAGSGESEIRRWILENDWLEAIVALPNDMFYNTGIGTYVWILSNHKETRRKDKVQLIDASEIHTPMRKSLGSKRKMLSDGQVDDIARLYDAFEHQGKSKVFATTDFAYRRITIERPLRRSAQLRNVWIEELRFAPQDFAEPMRWLYSHFESEGEFASQWQDPENYGHFTDEQQLSFFKQLKARYPELYDTQIDTLLMPKIWQEQRNIQQAAQAAQQIMGREQFDNFNVFEWEWQQAIKEAGFKLTAKETKQVMDLISWTNPEADPVLSKITKKGLSADPRFGRIHLDEVAIARYSSNDVPLFSATDLVSFCPDSDLREYENVPLLENIHTYVAREVLPHVPDAWIDDSKRDEKDGHIGIVGYEINFNRYFYQYQAPRKLSDIDAELKSVEAEIAALLGEVTE